MGLNTDTATAEKSRVGLPSSGVLPAGYIYGCNVEGTEATNAWAVSTGSCRNSTNAIDIDVSSPLTGAINTSGANGRDTGAAAAGVWHVYVIQKSASDTTKATLCSLSATAPTLPSGYTLFRRVGTIRHDGTDLSGTIQYGKGSIRSTVYGPQLSQFLSTSSTANFTFDWSTYVPSTAHMMHSGFAFYSAGGASYDNQASMNFSPWQSGFYIDNSGYGIARGGPVGTIPLLQGGSRITTYVRSGAGTMGLSQYCYGYEESV